MTADDTGAAQIYDQGYRRYDGPRSGVGGAIRSLVEHSVRDALGVRRLARHKVFPAFSVLAAYIPAIAFVGMAALLPPDFHDFLPTYAEYYGFVIAAIFLFAGFVTPELLCKDRRTGMLGVYLASPLNRPLYLLGKAIAVLLLMLLVTLGPPLLMLIAYSLESRGPAGFTEWITTLVHVVVSSLTMGSLFAAVALAVASVTDRTAVATSTALALFPGSAIVSDILVQEADLSGWFRLFNLPGLARELVFRIHDEYGLWNASDDPTTLALVAAWAFWTFGSLGFVWWRYRSLLVRR
ncbi:MAG: ABC transporter permease subunit [Acidimicrobiales bacterium]